MRRRFTNQAGGIALSALFRGGFQGLQQEAVLIGLQTQGADVAPCLLKDEIRGTLCGKKTPG